MIHAIPAAAAVPESSAVGSDQNTANAHRMPALARVSAAKPTGPGIPGMALAAKAHAATMQDNAKCQRLSPVASECRPTKNIATTVTAEGIVNSQPMATGSFVRVSFITCGSQKPMP